MAIEHGIGDWNWLRPAIDRLKFGDGLTRDEMMNQSADLRDPIIEMLPGDFVFRDAGSVFSYLERLEREGIFELEPFPPPSGYGDRSTTGVTFTGHPVEPGVGSGSGSGSTGSSAQTGVGRSGTSDHLDRL